MLRTERISDGTELACGRLDALASLTDTDLGRWMIELAESYAAGSCRRRTMRPATAKPSTAHRAPRSGASR